VLRKKLLYLCVFLLLGSTASLPIAVLAETDYSFEETELITDSASSESTGDLAAEDHPELIESDEQIFFDDETSIPATTISDLPTVDSQKKMSFFSELSDSEKNHFKFEVETVQTTIGENLAVHIFSLLPTDTITVRIPTQARFLPEFLPKGVNITHKAGEYWSISSNEKTDIWTLPVVFQESGQFFLSVGDDAQHIYIEVSESGESLGEESIVAASEHYLDIPEEVIAIEEQRIWEEILVDESAEEIGGSNVVSVNSWIQFRSAWNNSRTTSILVNSVTFEDALLGVTLNTRSNSISISPGGVGLLSFGNSGQSLIMSGNANLILEDGLYITDLPVRSSLVNDNRRNPIIMHNGLGQLTINPRGRTLTIRVQTGIAPSVIRGRNIEIYAGTHIYTNEHVTGTTTPFKRSSAIHVDNGTLSFKSTTVGNAQTSYFIGVPFDQTPITSTASSRFDFSTSNVVMGTRSSISGTGLNPRESWTAVDAVLTGVNVSTVERSTSTPGDFSSRYTEYYRTTGQNNGYNVLALNARDREWVEPPVLRGEVIVNHIDTGGNQLAESEILTGEVGQAYSTNPIELDGWRLVDTPTNANGTFMQNTITVNYIYDRVQGTLNITHQTVEGTVLGNEKISDLVGQRYVVDIEQYAGYTFERLEIGNNSYDTPEIIIPSGETDVIVWYSQDNIGPVSPLDPLDPDKEVNPDNPPVLPEDQGLVSIDFVSQFNFGEVPIQAGKATYEALPQRLLKEDGAANTEEERPNYIQISDRRNAEARGGWSLMATLENEGFKNDAGESLRGAEIQLTNQELTKPSINTGSDPSIVQTTGAVLSPGNSTRLLDASALEGQGTWIYRFGNQDSAGSSVKLAIPAGANPKATSYQATINWELSAVPGNG
jgi:hypothetical protein